MMTALVRGGLALMAATLLLTGGCRASKDRIRVLEAEKADAERRNMTLRSQNADVSAKLMQAESKAESEEARRKAAELELEMLKEDRTEAPEPERTTVDIGGLRSRLGPNTEIHENADGGATIILASDITFRAGRADLNRNAEATLSRVVRALKETDGVRSVRIEGHTDSDPIRKSGWSDNKELSLARAKRVRMYLVANGINEEVLEVEGRGATVPIESNATPAGKAKNRRVEIILMSQ
jgi:flagellar motor protein MotB